MDRLRGYNNKLEEVYFNSPRVEVLCLYANFIYEVKDKIKELALNHLDGCEASLNHMNNVSLEVELFVSKSARLNKEHYLESNIERYHRDITKLYDQVVLQTLLVLERNYELIRESENYRNKLKAMIINDESLTEHLIFEEFLPRLFKKNHIEHEYGEYILKPATLFKVFNRHNLTKERKKEMNNILTWIEEVFCEEANQFLWDLRVIINAMLHKELGVAIRKDEHLSKHFTLFNKIKSDNVCQLDADNIVYNFAEAIYQYQEEKGEEDSRVTF